MKTRIGRRRFLKNATVAGLAMGLPRPALANAGAPSDRVRVAVMGTNGRGTQLARIFARAQGGEVAYVCDVDDNAIAKALKGLSGVGAPAPKTAKDFRRALDDASVDALVVAAPDHWHAPAALLALAAGKHVYLEKPCSHNPQEGEWVLQAARKANRVVEMGAQRRSWPNVVEAIQKVREGVVGRVYFARGWYANTRRSIGKGKPADVPPNLDFDLWQGPAPRRPFRDNLVHYNWHWFWHWGTGEACNNGTHEIDVMRWGLGVDYPIRVVSSGGRYQFDDDWECPDTQVLAFDFEGRKTIAWEGRSCNGRLIEGLDRGITFHGENGTVLIDGNGYHVFDAKNQPVSSTVEKSDQSATNTTGPGDRLDALHVDDFIDSVRKGRRPSCDIEEGHKSVLLCHLGNIAQRVGRSLRCSPENGHIVGDDEAARLWRREYEKGWEPKV